MIPEDISRYWKSIVDTMADGLLVVDTEGTIIFINPAAEEITGYKNEEVAGQPCTVFESDTCMLQTAKGKLMHCNLYKLGKVSRKRCIVKRKDGTFVYLLKNATVLRDPDGKAIGGVESLTDISELLKKDQEIEFLKKELTHEHGFHGIIGKSPTMEAVFDLVKNAAESDAPVVILGESGTGKELVASAIHRLSQRSKGPFIKVNCASLNESLLESELFGHVKGSFTGATQTKVGLFKVADGGTLFLDEVSNISPSIQAKLLRVLQERVITPVGGTASVEIDIRLIAATNRNLKEMVSRNEFREDLFYRLNIVPIHLPTLRERFEDLPILISHFLRIHSEEIGKDVRGLSPAAMAILKQYPFPGNIRELENIIERAVVLAKEDLIQPGDLELGEFMMEELPCSADRVPESSEELKVMKKKLREEAVLPLEKAFLIKALERCDWNITKAADDVGMLRPNFQALLKRHGISNRKREP